MTPSYNDIIYIYTQYIYIWMGLMTTMGLGKQSMMTLAQFWNLSGYLMCGRPIHILFSSSTAKMLIQGVALGDGSNAICTGFFVNPATDSNSWKFEKRPQAVWGYVWFILGI